MSLKARASIVLVIQKIAVKSGWKKKPHITSKIYEA